MKKFFLSIVLVAATGLYALNESSAKTPLSAMPVITRGDDAVVGSIVSTQPTPQATPPKTTTVPTQTIPPKKTTTPAPKPTPTPAPKPAPKPAGQYIDGSYTGSVADAYYGNIEVRATISGGKLTDVTFLQYPSDRGTSREINGQAMPMLKSEAIAAQSANVDIISGATDTSYAFRESLGAALAQAKNSA